MNAFLPRKSKLRRALPSLANFVLAGGASLLPVSGQEKNAAVPAPFSLERYAVLWETDSFSSDPEPRSGARSNHSAPRTCILVGWGSLNGREVAYIQMEGSARIEEVDRESNPNVVLLRVEKAPGGPPRAIVFRKDGVTHRAEPSNPDATERKDKAYLVRITSS